MWNDPSLAVHFAGLSCLQASAKKVLPLTGLTRLKLPLERVRKMGSTSDPLPKAFGAVAQPGSVRPHCMRITKYLHFCRLFVLAALLSGCETGGGYNDLGNGYGEAFSSGLLPDSAGHSSILYSSRTRRRQAVWPTLLNGYYGNAVVHGDLIMFQARWPDSMRPEGIPAFLAAKSGSPAVDITKAVRRVMAANIKGASPSDLEYSVDYSHVGQTNPGVCISFPRLTNGSLDHDWQEAVITWQEIEALVTRIRETGKSQRAA